MILGIKESYIVRCGRVWDVHMDGAADFCNYLHVSTPCLTRSGSSFPFARYVYSPNYAVPTLGIYRGEEYSLFETSVLQNWWLWWLENKNWQNEVELRLLRSPLEPRYSDSTAITTTNVITIIQAFIYFYKPISPTPTSVVF
jgi:hypothetical protein